MRHMPTRATQAVLGVILMLIVAPGVATAQTSPESTTFSSSTAAKPSTQPLTDSELVLDEAGVLDVDAVVEQINALGAKRNFRIAVVTTNASKVRGEGKHFRGSLQAHLEQVDPPFMHKDEPGLEDDVLLIAVAPKIREIAVVAGNDVDLTASRTRGIIRSMTPSARATASTGDFTPVVVKGATDAYDTMAEDLEGLFVEPLLRQFANFGLLAGAIAIVFFFLRAIQEFLTGRKERKAERERLAELRTWTGPGATALGDSHARWEAVMHELDSAPDGDLVPSLRPHLLNPADALAAIKKAVDNDFEATDEQRIDPAQRKQLEDATQDVPRKVQAIESEISYARRKGDWEGAWEAHYEQVMEYALSDARKARSLLPASTPKGLDEDLRRVITEIEAQGAEVKEQVTRGDIGLLRAEKMLVTLRNELEESQHRIGSQIGRSTRRNALTGSQRNIDGSDLILFAAMTSTWNSHSLNSSTSSTSPSFSSSSSGFDGGSGGF